jgi:Nitrogenase molybdenum-iron protein, alpha and beta chains
MGAAEYNIVIRAEGIECAEYMKSNFGIPYVYKKPYGITGTMEWLAEIAETFSLKIDVGAVRKQTDDVKTYLSQYKSYLRRAKNKDVIIYADYDTAIGMASLMTDLSLTPKVFSKTAPASVQIADNVTVAPTEDELKSAIAAPHYALLGDDTVRLMSNGESFFQIANPNMERYNFYPRTPNTGFCGVLRWLQELMNFERAKH